MPTKFFTSQKKKKNLHPQQARMKDGVRLASSGAAARAWTQARTDQL
jgi:hypothetical protein